MPTSPANRMEAGIHPSPRAFSLLLCSGRWRRGAAFLEEKPRWGRCSLNTGSENAYRLPDATRIGPGRAAVSNLERSVDFYTGVLGPSLLSETASEGRNASDVMRRNASTRYLSPQFWFVLSFALMTRLARMVVSGLPHHVTQRGNR